MKVSKYIAYFLLIIMLISLIGCTEEKVDDEPKTVFGLKETPSSAVDTQTVKYDRVNTEYTSELTPSDSYGQLVPFAGTVNTYNRAGESDKKSITVALYGLCNTKGAVVVDAVYDAIKKQPTDEGGFVYELIKGADGSDIYAGERWVVASNGSWVFKIPENSAYCSTGAERVVLMRRRKSGKKVFTYHDFYDFKGKRKFTFQKAYAEDSTITYTIGKFSEGVAPINVMVKTPDKVEKGEPQTYTELRYAYYIDNAGKRKFEELKFSYCEEFKNGYAVASLEDGKYGVLVPTFEWFIEPQYRDIDYNEQKMLFACAENEQYVIIDKDKKFVKAVECKRGYVDILDSERLIYKKTNADTGRAEYFYGDVSAPFSCDETGMFPDSEISVGGLYVCTYSGTGTIFGEDGNHIVSIGDFGKLVERFGNTAVVVNSNNKKVCFVTVGTKLRTEWINMQYTRQSFAGRYLVLKNTENSVAKYSIFDILTEEFLYHNSDFIGVSEIDDNVFVSIVRDGKATVYDGSFNVVLTSLHKSKH